VNGAQRQHDIELPKRLDFDVRATVLAEAPDRVLGGKKVEIRM